MPCAPRDLTEEVSHRRGLHSAPAGRACLLNRTAYFTHAGMYTNTYLSRYNEIGGRLYPSYTCKGDLL